MVRYALDNGVKAVMIAGDLFDTQRVSARTADFVLEQIRKAPAVDFLYLRGNHDERENVFAGMDLPENFKQFGSRWTSYRYGDVVITGLELDEENCLSMYGDLNLSGADTNIVMLHGQESTQPGRELIAIPLLRNRNIRYLALGHIHSYQISALDMDGVYSYCGCLEGRGFDECGEKGFVLLETGDGRVKSSFVPFASRRLETVPVDITDKNTVSQIQSAMETAAAGIPASSMVKFILTGTYTTQTQKDIPFLRKLLEGSFWIVNISDESRLYIDKSSYEHDVSLKGEFIRMVMASDACEEEKEQIILCGLRALAGEEVSL
jgi:DNA repair exonuclease SbcCD nuclease subunit